VSFLLDFSFSPSIINSSIVWSISFLFLISVFSSFLSGELEYLPLRFLYTGSGMVSAILAVKWPPPMQRGEVEKELLIDPFPTIESLIHGKWEGRMKSHSSSEKFS
jgi:hypothetical protein